MECAEPAHLIPIGAVPLASASLEFTDLIKMYAICATLQQLSLAMSVGAPPPIKSTSSTAAILATRVVPLAMETHKTTV